MEIFFRREVSDDGIYAEDHPGGRIFGAGLLLLQARHQNYMVLRNHPSGGSMEYIEVDLAF